MTDTFFGESEETKTLDDFSDESSEETPELKAPFGEAERQGAAMALISEDPESLTNVYNQVRAEVEIAGVSPTVEDRRMQRIESEVRGNLITMRNLVNSDDLLDASEEAIARQNILIASGGPTLADMVVETVSQYPADDPYTGKVNTILGQRILEESERARQIQAALNTSGKLGLVNDAYNLFDFAMAAITPDFAADGLGIIWDTIPDPSKLEGIDNLAFGEALEEWVKQVRSLPPREFIDVLKKVSKGIESRIDFLGFNDENDLKRYFLSSTFLNSIETTDEQLKEIAQIETTFQLLEWLPFLAWHRITNIRAGAKIRRSALLSSIDKGHKAFAQNLVDNIILGKSDEGSTALGASRDEALSTHAMPQPKGTVDPPTSGPDASIVHQRDPELMDILGQDRYLYDNSAVQRSTSFIDDTVDAVVKTKPTVHVSKSSLRVDPFDPLQHELDLTIGANSQVGFSTLREALDVAELFGDGLEGSRVTFFADDPKSGRIIPVTRKGDDTSVFTDVPLQGSTETSRAARALQEGIDALRAANKVTNPTAAQKAAATKLFNKLLDQAQKVFPENGRLVLEENLRQTINSPKPSKLTPLDEMARNTFRSFDFDESLTQPGNYFVRINVKSGLGPKDMGEFSDTQKALTGITGPMAGITDKASTFSRDVLDLGSTADRLDAKLKKLYDNAVHPYSSLSHRERNMVDFVMQRAEHLTNEKMIDAPLTDAQLDVIFNGEQRLIAAYQGVRKAFDMMYMVTNQKVFRDLKAENWKHFKAGEYESVGKSINSLDDIEEFGSVEKVTVYDADGKTLRAMSKAELEGLRREGGMVARLRFSERVGNDSTNIAIAKAGEVDELPTQVLRHRVNYIPRIHKAGVIIREAVPTTFNGVARKGELGRAIMTARSLKEADTWIRLNEERIGTKLVRELPREREGFDFLNNQSADYFANTGQLFTSKRGEGLGSVSGAYNVASLSDSIRIGIQRSSKVASKDQLVRTQKEAWAKTYLNRLVDAGVLGVREWPQSLSEFRPTSKATKDVDFERLRADAIAHWQRINQLDDVDNSWYMQSLIHTYNSIAKAADALSGKGLTDNAAKNLSEFFLTTRFDPLAFMKSASFLAFITAKPLRQLILQMQQVSLYFGAEHGAKYFLSGRGFRDFQSMILIKAASGAGREAEMIKALNAKLGYKDGEVEMMWKAFKDSGFIERIGANQLITRMTGDLRRGVKADDMDSSVGRHMLRRGFDKIEDTKDNFGRATTLLRNIGFDSGEFTNITFAWLTSLNRFRKMNPDVDWTSTDVLRKINADADQLSLNMGRSGRLSYQQGFASAAMQYFSIQQKTAQLMMRGLKDAQILGKQSKSLDKVADKLGNKTFTPQEARRMAALSLGLYGTAGLGFLEVYQEMRDKSGLVVPDSVNAALEGGIIELSVNSFLTAATGQDVDLSISEAFAPMQGFGQLSSQLSPFAIMEAMTSSDRSVLELMFGPSWTVAKNFGNAVSLMKSLWLGTTMPTTEKLVISAKEFGTILGSYGDIVKAQAAMKTGHIMSNNGDPMVKASMAELHAKAMFGLRTKSEEDVFRIYKQIQGMSEGGGNAHLGEKKILDQAAKEYYDHMKRIVTRYKEGEYPVAEVARIAANHSEFFNFLWTPNQADYLNRKLVAMDMKQPFSERLSTIVAGSVDFIKDGDRLRSIVLNNKNLFESEAEWQALEEVVNDIANFIDRKDIEVELDL